MVKNRVKMEKHYNVGISHPRWIGGKPKCLDCGRQLSHYSSKRCKLCANKFRGSPNKGKTGKMAPNFKTGESLKQHYCKDCKIEIWWGSIRCHSRWG